MTTTHLDAPAAALLFHALSDPTRLEIIDRLRTGERCVCDLMDLMDAAQSRLSFHLRVLKDSGLVSDRRDGRWVYYTLDRDALVEAREQLDALLKSPRVSSKAAACCD